MIIYRLTEPLGQIPCIGTVAGRGYITPYIPSLRKKITFFSILLLLFVQ
jgi:hypothetical protein